MVWCVATKNWGYIDNHIKPNIGSVPLSKLSSLDLQKLYKKLLNGGRVERIESKVSVPRRYGTSIR